MNSDLQGGVSLQARADFVKSIDRLIVYGERPITELSLIMMTDEDFGHLINGIELSDGGRIPFDGESQLLQVFVEAPLGRQFGVVDILLIYDDFSVMCEVKPCAYDKAAKRLETQIPRYVASLGKAVSDRQSGLVRLVQSTISKKRIYLIAITNDSAFPPKLRDFLERLEHPCAMSLGWTSYTHLGGVLGREGFVIDGYSRNPWTRKKR